MKKERIFGTQNIMAAQHRHAVAVLSPPPVPPRGEQAQTRK
jgi:hypothetical protein